MKINYKNTALHFLEGKKIDFHIPKGNNMTRGARLNLRDDVSRVFPRFKDHFAEKIRYISIPFYEAYRKAKHRLVDVFDKEEINETGTLIFQNGGIGNTIFYVISTSGVGDSWKYKAAVMIFNSSSHEALPALDFLMVENENVYKTFMWEGHEQAGATDIFFVSEIIGMLTFLKYCELETKIVDPKRKTTHVRQKYVNETNHKVEILDSTWFTTIVRSEGFDVGGHFRWQRCGPGLTQTKFIWISPFEKQGYTSRAKVQLYNP